MNPIHMNAIKEQLRKELIELLDREGETDPWYPNHAEVLKDIDRDFVPPDIRCRDTNEYMSWHPAVYQPLDYKRYLRPEVKRAESGDLFAIRRLGNFYSCCHDLCITEVEKYRRVVEAMKWSRAAFMFGYGKLAEGLVGLHFGVHGWESDYEWKKWDALAKGDVYWCYDDFYKKMRTTLDRSDYVAADSGYPMRQYRLGDAYFYGMSNVKVSHQQAAYWYGKSARQGYAMACVALGDCYYWGYGLHANKELAEHWYLRAAMIKSGDGSSHWIRNLTKILKNQKVWQGKKIRNRHEERMQKWAERI